MFRRSFSLGLILLWALAGALFASIWFVTSGQWPPTWARIAAGVVLLPVLMPFEASLARRSEGRHRRGAVS